MTETRGGREDIDFETWYTPWEKLWARAYTAEELQTKLRDAEAEARVAAKNRFHIIWHTHTLGNAKNFSASDSDYAIALRGAIEIHRLFPEEASRPSMLRPPAPKPGGGGAWLGKGIRDAIDRLLHVARHRLG